VTAKNQAASGKQTKVRALRNALTKYRAGRFQNSGSGGANGMVFHRDAEGREFYVGGFQEEHAPRIVEVLNLTMDLLEVKD
jgi:hypothetical protein